MMSLADCRRQPVSRQPGSQRPLALLKSELESASMDLKSSLPEEPKVSRNDFKSLGTERHGVKKRKLAQQSGRKDGKIRGAIKFKFADTIVKNKDCTQQSIEALLKLDQQSI